ncbi:hypothetical protein [Spirosoma montaniterrae]|uniref:Methyltransferase FkbM domain-containing protein n=1 Tax=Spirosoma montaniterrae TaxID=1178516 RepID=A0A1P9WZK1_9BACT|nr:hypothetical protein [Spirosoma montaniterrae]AQG80775.1 hypothetical protein AWR27_16480 [Spirosoma montaniterrae]
MIVPKRLFLSMFGVRSRRNDWTAQQQDTREALLSTFVNLTPSGSLLIDIGHSLGVNEDQQARLRGSFIRTVSPKPAPSAAGLAVGGSPWMESDWIDDEVADARQHGLRVGGIRIDAASFDYVLLQEWLVVIREDKPVLCIDLPDDQDRDRALDLLGALGYVVYTIHDNQLIRFVNSPAWLETGQQSLICVTA